MDHEAYLARRNMAALDGLRAVAIVAVIFHHTTTPLASWWPSQRGFLGVDLFFVLSGFLIVTLLLRERDAHGEVSLKAFYMRRSLRIFPVYYGLLLGLTVLFLIVPGVSMAERFFENLPFLATYTSNWVEIDSLLEITWSLSAEEQFYLVWPALERIARPVILPVLALLVFVNQVINFRLLDGWLHDTLGLVPSELSILQITFTPILLGVLLAHLLHRKGGYAVVARALRPAWVPFALIALLALLIHVPGDISGWPRLGMHILMTLLLASLVIYEDQPLARPLRHSWVARVGAVSYGMYLFHMFAAAVAKKITAATGFDVVPLTTFALCAVMTWIIAELSFRFYEQPFLRLKKRFARTATSKVQAQQAAAR